MLTLRGSLPVFLATRVPLLVVVYSVFLGRKFEVKKRKKEEN
jgi:hypothetical protein